MPSEQATCKQLTWIQAEGYTRQEITFTGSINIKQTGHATLHLARHDETYLIPLPNIKIRGILTGSPYPELEGTHYIPSTTGYTSSIDFSGRGLFTSSDKKHSFVAKVYRTGQEDNPLYSILGNWDGQFTIHDCSQRVDIETFDVTTAKTTSLTTDPISEQDPWESRRAWKGVREALESGNMQDAADAKSSLENGQREMHKTDKDGKAWKRLFYEAVSQTDETTSTLAKTVGLTFNPEDTVGVWKFKRLEWEQGQFKKPFHGDLLPDNTRDASFDSTKTRVAGHQDEADGGAAASITTSRAAQPTESMQHHLNPPPSMSFYQQALAGAPEDGQGHSDTTPARTTPNAPQNQLNYRTSPVPTGSTSDTPRTQFDNRTYVIQARSTPETRRTQLDDRTTPVQAVTTSETPPSRLDDRTSPMQAGSTSDTPRTQLDDKISLVQVGNTFVPRNQVHGTTAPDSVESASYTAPTQLNDTITPAEVKTPSGMPGTWLDHTTPPDLSENESSVPGETQRETPLELAQPRRTPVAHDSEREGDGKTDTDLTQAQSGIGAMSVGEERQHRRAPMVYGPQREGDGTSETGPTQGQSDTGPMTSKEKSQVEDFLRDQYSSRKGKARKSG